MSHEYHPTDALIITERRLLYERGPWVREGVFRVLASVLWGILAAIGLLAQSQFKGNVSIPWAEAIGEYRELAEQHDAASLLVIGMDDGGQPIHLFVLHGGTMADPDSLRAYEKRIIWITNGIHPGEPDGIDASIMLARSLLLDERYTGLLAHTGVCIVPVYNVSGALQRNSTTRVNQNGPEAYGFRGNALNLDLNRDFIKADSRNTRDLITALNVWDPDIYFETHVSNGADHQYVMELLTTHPDRQEASLREFTMGVLEPELYEWMNGQDILMCPYFETRVEYPEQGLTGFVDGPRYSSGYAALRQRIGILSESHMLKPFPDRVNATYQLMLATINVLDRHGDELSLARKQARSANAKASGFGFNHLLDTTVSERIGWKGYKAVHETSMVSGSLRLRYDRGQPTDTVVPFMDHATPAFRIAKPKGYIIPQAYRDVIGRMRTEGITMEYLKFDTIMTVEVQRIESYETVDEPYEGHYLHRNIRTISSLEEIPIQAGDVLIPLGHATDRSVMEMLEPRASDSFFAWGFFDGVLQQKEWFSSYVFEDVAAELLSNDPVLRASLEKEKASDPVFAADAWEQLYWIYQRSPYYEVGRNRYPVLRLP